MKKILFYICIVLLSGSCVNNVRKEPGRKQVGMEQANDDSAIYAAINYLLDDSANNQFLKYQNLAEKASVAFPFQFKDDSLKLRSLNTIFTAKDMDFILDQKVAFYYFKIEHQKIKNKTVVPVDNLVDSPDFSKVQPYSYISCPLFNIKKDKLIICMGYCCGAMCAEGGTYIYQKINERWIMIKVLEEWMS
jgi:hypothetical protein